MKIDSSNEQHLIGPQAGATLLEVLVALVVLSLGCIVAAGLQATSQKTNHDAQQRLIATFLVNDIIEKMRSNPQGLIKYDADSLTGTTIKIEPNPVCDEGNTCEPNQLAAHDLWEWEQAISGSAIQVGAANVGGLIQPTGCININGGLVEVVLSWFGIDALSDTGVESGVSACGTAGNNRRQVRVNTFISQI
jgi:type IV pilus assembly protein PilV